MMAHLIFRKIGIQILNYESFEEQIETNLMDFYKIIRESSKGHEANLHDYSPFAKNVSDKIKKLNSRLTN